MSTLETRLLLPRQHLELRSTQGRLKLTGLAVPYNSFSAPLAGGVREIIRPGAFARTLESDADVRADVEHDRNVRLARRKAGTLSLTDSAKGLRVAIQLPDTTVGRDTAEEVRAGLLDAMSISMIVKTEEFVTLKSEVVRGIREAKLTAVSLTQFPAYPQTAGTVGLKVIPRPSPHDTRRRRLDLAELEHAGMAAL